MNRPPAHITGPPSADLPTSRNAAGTSAPDLPRGMTKRDLDRLLDDLDHKAVVVFEDSEGDVLIVATGDPDGEMRRLRVNAKHALAIKAVAWVGDAAAGTLAEAARGRLVSLGKPMKGRWVACRPDIAEQAVIAEASDRRIWVYTDADRLRLALSKAERRMQRMDRA